jgi:hypothetical protein
MTAYCYVHPDIASLFAVCEDHPVRGTAWTPRAGAPAEVRGAALRWLPGAGDARKTALRIGKANEEAMHSIPLGRIPL